MAAKGMGDACIDDDTAAAYVAGALGDDERLRIEDHLSGCAACRTHLDQLAETTGANVRVARPVRSRWDGLVAGTRIGRFVLDAPLGSGGMGVVWASHDRDLDRRVALKMVRADVADEALQNRLLREARAMARLTHPNVVAVYDLLVHDAKLVIAMELVEGENLARWLARKRSFTEVRDAFVAAGRGLAAAHAVGLVHRDFKPENVLVAARDGRVCVTDFGLSSLVPRGGAPTTSDETTSHAGTPAYMAPEQLRGEVADAASDQFAFAVALHRALYRVHPFEGDTPEARSRAVLEGRLGAVPSSDIAPGWLRPVILRALAPRREDRWPSMDVLLAKLVEDRGVRRRRAAFAVALLASAALTIAALRQDGAHAHRTGCEGESAWTDAKRDELARGFRATNLAYADDTWRATARTLDRYGAEWSETARVSCAKADDAVELRRRACLQERKIELAALVDVLRAADRDVVSSAPAAAEALTPLARCNEMVVLRSATAPPVDPRRAAEVTEVRARLAHLSALLKTGKGAEALPLAPDIVVSARKTGYLPLEGEALLLHGHLLTQRYDRALEAERLLYSAVAIADRVGDDRTRARAWAELLFNVGHVRAHEDPWWIREQAEAALVRLGGDDGIATQLENAVAGAYYRRGRFEEATHSARRTVALAEKTFGKTSVRYGVAVGNLATLLIAVGGTEEAIARARDAERIFVAQLGPKHEQTANVSALIGEAHFMELRYAEAEAHQRRALAIAAEVPMPKLREAKYLADLARTLAETDRTAEALALAERSRALFDAIAAHDHPERFTFLLAEGTARIATNEPALAIAPLERALGLDAAGKAIEAAEAERLLAEALVATKGDRARADALAAHAAEAYAKHARGARQTRDRALLEKRASR